MALTPLPDVPPPHPPDPLTLTVREPADLVAVAEVVLGFPPTDSAVLLTFGAARPFHARVDLPPPDDPDAAAALAELLLGPVLAHDAPHAALLLVGDDDRRTGPAWAALEEAFVAADVPLVEALRVRRGHWWSLLSTDPSEKLLPTSPHPFVAAAAVTGRVARGSREELVASLDPDERAAERVSRALDRLAPPEGRLAEGGWGHRRVVSALDGRERLSDADAARLLRGWHDLGVRDAAWAAISAPRLRPAIDLLSDLVRRSPPGLRAAPAALLGWTAWRAGDGALAWCAVDRCRAVAPSYSLADLVDELLTRAVPPGDWSDWADGLDWRAVVLASSDGDARPGPAGRAG
ncbi:MAG: hypothetical protein CMH83_20185 [Nocardioides sp.]|nr:hypothetical protein [Nocardioides sp.]